MCPSRIMAKQKRNSHKAKDKGKDEKSDTSMLNKHHLESPFGGRILEDYALRNAQTVIVKIEAMEDASDVSDTRDDAPEALHPELDDRDTSSISWDTDTSEIHHAVETNGSERQNGKMEKQNSYVIDDSCSTCSTNSAPSVVVNGSYKGNSLPNNKGQTSITVQNQQSKDVDLGGSFPPSNATSDAAHLSDDSDSYGDPQSEQEVVIITLKDKIQKLEQHLVEKDKQKRNSRKAKDKGKDEKSDTLMLNKHHPESPFGRRILEDYALRN